MEAGFVTFKFCWRPHPSIQQAAQARFLNGTWIEVCCTRGWLTGRRCLVAEFRRGDPDTLPFLVEWLPIAECSGLADACRLAERKVMQPTL